MNERKTGRANITRTAMCSLLYKFSGCKMHVFVWVPTRSFFILIYLLLVHSISARIMCGDLTIIVWYDRATLAICSCLGCPLPLSLSLAHAIPLVHTHAHFTVNCAAVPLFCSLLRAIFSYSSSVLNSQNQAIPDFSIQVPSWFDRHILHYCVPATRTHTHPNII